MSSERKQNKKSRPGARNTKAAGAKRNVSTLLFLRPQYIIYMEGNASESSGICALFI